MPYSKRKLEAAALQISVLRGALFALENRLVLINGDPGIAAQLRVLYRDVAALEAMLTDPALPAMHGDLTGAEVRH